MEQTTFYLKTSMGHTIGLIKMGSQVFKGVLTENGILHDFMWNGQEKEAYLLPHSQPLDDKSLVALKTVLYDKGF